MYAYGHTFELSYHNGVEKWFSCHNGQQMLPGLCCCPPYHEADTAHTLGITWSAQM